MIILESEWNEAAGVFVQTATEDGEQAPSYSESAEQQTSSGSVSGTSFIQTSRSRNASLVRGPTPTSSATTSNISGSCDPPPDTTWIDGPVTYVFAPAEHSLNAMVLRSQTAMIPLYHISVRMNCFIPSSYITTIHRGDSEYGEEAGHFEMGVSIRKPTVVVHGYEKIIDTVLSKGGSRSLRTWQWRFSSDQTKQLSWTFDSPVKYCYLGTKSVGNGATMLAAFTPPPLAPRADGKPSPVTILKIFPEGHTHFDHILISALILERRRLTPA